MLGRIQAALSQQIFHISLLFLVSQRQYAFFEDCPVLVGEIEIAEQRGRSRPAIVVYPHRQCGREHHPHRRKRQRKDRYARPDAFFCRAVGARKRVGEEYQRAERGKRQRRRHRPRDEISGNRAELKHGKQEQHHIEQIRGEKRSVTPSARRKQLPRSQKCRDTFLAEQRPHKRGDIHRGEQKGEHNEEKSYQPRNHI